jgi:hypothetical protein
MKFLVSWKNMLLFIKFHGNPGPDLGQAEKYDGIIEVNYN